ncbi:MAG: dihydroneopterin aldolase [Nitrospira sp. LK265]|nr:dihydroneopterin aldolase [Nitrospira sp.]NGZ61274.1 dihydroneopterin aldolase [Nitrospira sp. LK265]
MGGQIVIEQLEFRGRCGVTPEERTRPQPLAVDLELDCRLSAAGLSDDLVHTIDYAKVAQLVIDIGTVQESQLLETLGERLLAALFDEFPISRVKLWLRKLHPPISFVTRSVGICIERTRLAQQVVRADPPPAQFLIQQLHRLPKGKVLDVASGSGRHALFLASLGYQVEAVDRDEQALTQLSAVARTRHLSGISSRVLDLEQSPPWGPNLGHETYDVILIFFYLNRPLLPYLIDALKPGGVLLYETFTIDNHVRHQHPKRREFCLAPCELLSLTPGLRVLHYDEGLHERTNELDSVYTAQLAAQKPLTSGPST